MPHTAGTHMRNMARMTWIWIMVLVRARRALSPSPTTIRTRMLTTGQTWCQIRLRRPHLLYLLPDPSAHRPGKQLGKVTMDPDKVSGHTIAIIMNAGEGEDMGEGGVEVEDAVVPVKGRCYNTTQKIVPRRTVLLHHSPRPRP